MAHLDRATQLAVITATTADASELAALHTAVAEHLTRHFGKGHWSYGKTEKIVRRAIETSRVLVARISAETVATLRLATKKPWAIDPAYFTKARRPLYLLDMAVAPGLQRQGIGRALLKHAVAAAQAWPGDAIWLDAYDTRAGAGPFYAKCGFREVAKLRYRGTPLVYYELPIAASAELDA